MPQRCSLPPPTMPVLHHPVPRASPHAQSHFSGTVVGESAMRREQDVGSPLTFDFQVSRGGRPVPVAGDGQERRSLSPPLLGR